MQSEQGPMNLRPALQHAWDTIREQWLEGVGKEAATGEDVRSAVQERLDDEPRSNAAIQRFWKPLSKKQKKERCSMHFRTASTSVSAKLLYGDLTHTSSGSEKSWIYAERG